MLSGSVIRLTSLAACLPAALAAGMLLAGCPRPNGNEEIVVTVSDEGGGEAGPGQSADQLLTLAGAEGEVTWFTSIPEPEATRFAHGFEAEFPPLRVRLVRGGTFDLVERIERDIGAGTPEADVLHVLDPAIFVALRQRGELMYYASPAATAIPPEYRDPGYWNAARMVALGIAYHRKHVASADVTRWPALLQPRWKGKIGVKDAQTAGSAYAAYYFLREKYGVDFWEQMAAQRPRIYKTEEELLDALSKGEIQVAAGVMGYSLSDVAPRGRSLLGMAWPTDGVPLVIGPVAILSRAPHPSAAKLFTDYCLSREGQEKLRDLLGAYSPRPDVASPRGAPKLQDLKLLRPPAGWGEYLEKQGDLRAEYSRLFHSESE